MCIKVITSNGNFKILLITSMITFVSPWAAINFFILLTCLVYLFPKISRSSRIVEVLSMNLFQIAKINELKLFKKNSFRLCLISESSKKNVKEDSFFIFDFTIKKYKRKSNIIKIN